MQSVEQCSYCKNTLESVSFFQDSAYRNPIIYKYCLSNEHYFNYRVYKSKEIYKTTNNYFNYEIVLFKCLCNSNHNYMFNNNYVNLIKTTCVSLPYTQNMECDSFLFFTSYFDELYPKKKENLMKIKKSSNGQRIEKQIELNDDFNIKNLTKEDINKYILLL